VLLLTCKQSIIADGSSSSIAPMSFENLFNIRPGEQQINETVYQTELQILQKS
jgi:hypothetical protein